MVIYASKPGRLCAVNSPTAATAADAVVVCARRIDERSKKMISLCGALAEASSRARVPGRDSEAHLHKLEAGGGERRRGRMGGEKNAEKRGQVLSMREMPREAE